MVEDTSTRTAYKGNQRSARHKVHQSSPPRQPRHNISKLAERHLINNWSEDRTLVIVTIRRARASLPGNLLSGLTATIPAQNLHLKSFEHKRSWNKAFAACIQQSVSLFLCPWWWDDHDHYISLSWWSDFAPPSDLQFPQFFPYPKHPRYWRKVPIRSKRNRVGSMGRTKATKATSTKEAKVTKTST